MHILLVAATTFEIQPTIDLLEKNETAAPPGSGTASLPGSGSTSNGASAGRLPVTSLITGVGSLATVWSLMRQIDRQRPSLVIQAGIAGCLTGKPPGSVVVVGEEVIADLGLWEAGHFQSLFDMKLAGENESPFTNGRLVNPYKELLTLTGIESVRGMTVNEISTDPKRIGWHQQNTAAVVESMEGAGLHYVCLQEGIPFLQLRAISNEVGIRDKTKWDIRAAIAGLNKQLAALLEKLSTIDGKVWQPQ